MTRELQIKVDRTKQALGEVFADTSGGPEENIAAFIELKEWCAHYIEVLEDIKGQELPPCEDK